MALLYFLGALVGIVLCAVIVNRLTGTRASYLESWVLAPDERELWRDSNADFAWRPRLGSAVSLSFPRLRRHSVLWTNQRLLIANQVLGSRKHMITHQVVFQPSVSGSGAAATAAASEFGGGFYGRGFSTLIAVSATVRRVNDRECVCIVPSDDSSAASNLLEAYLFTERLADLRAQVPLG